MKFVQFTYKAKNRPSNIRLGYLVGNSIVDLNGQDTGMPKTMVEFLQNDFYWKRIRDLKKSRSICTSSLHDVCLKPPIHGMSKVLGVVVNYQDHCDRHEVDIPEVPIIYSKFPSTVIGPEDSVIIRTDTCTEVDYEVQLCAVIGRVASNVKAKDANCYVFGYTIGQNISARNLQTEEEYDDNIFPGNSLDTFCPIGPCLVTPQEIGDVDNLNILCSLNNVCKQKSNTGQMIHKIPQLIELISSATTLLPGDLILTGTPAGVGMYATPPEYLKPGDLLRSEIENIGVLETKIAEYVPPERIPRHKEIRWPY